MDFTADGRQDGVKTASQKDDEIAGAEGSSGWKRTQMSWEPQHKAAISP
jgi:hypothetical protein